MVESEQKSVFSNAAINGPKLAVNNTRALQIVLDGKPIKQPNYFEYLGIYNIIGHCLPDLE